MRESAGRKNAVRKLRVAAYCRVSTEEEEQQLKVLLEKVYTALTENGDAVV